MFLRAPYSLLFLIINFLCFHPSYGQSVSEPPAPVLAYANLGVAFPGKTSVSGVSLVFKESWSVSFSIGNSFRNAKNAPSDYHNYFKLFSDNEKIQESLLQCRFTAGKTWLVSPPSRVRFNMRAGVGFGKFKSPGNFKKSDFPLFSNYTYSWKHQSVVSLLLQPTFEIPLSRYFGISIGLDANFNSYWNVFGLSLAINPGYFTDKRAPRK